MIGLRYKKETFFRHKIKKCKSTTHLVTSSHRNLGMPIIVGNLEPGKKGRVRERRRRKGEEERKGNLAQILN